MNTLEYKRTKTNVKGRIPFGKNLKINRGNYHYHDHQMKMR